MIFISTYISLKSINVSLPIGTCLLCSSRAAGLHPRKRYASRCSIWDWKVCARESGRAHQLVQRPEPMSLASQKFEMQLWGNDTEEEGGYRRGYLYPRKKKIKNHKCLFSRYDFPRLQQAPSLWSEQETLGPKNKFKNYLSPLLFPLYSPSLISLFPALLYTPTAVLPCCDSRPERQASILAGALADSIYTT